MPKTWEWWWPMGKLPRWVHLLLGIPANPVEAEREYLEQQWDAIKRAQEAQARADREMRQRIAALKAQVESVHREDE